MLGQVISDHEEENVEAADLVWGLDVIVVEVDQEDSKDGNGTDAEEGEGGSEEDDEDEGDSATTGTWAELAAASLAKDKGSSVESEDKEEEEQELAKAQEEDGEDPEETHMGEAYMGENVHDGPVLRVVPWDVHVSRYEAKQVFWFNDRFADAKFGIAYDTNPHPADRIAVVSWYWKDRV